MMVRFLFKPSITQIGEHLSPMAAGAKKIKIYSHIRGDDGMDFAKIRSTSCQQKSGPDLIPELKNPRNEEISASTFQKHIGLLGGDQYEKSYSGVKRCSVHLP